MSDCRVLLPSQASRHSLTGMLAALAITAGAASLLAQPAPAAAAAPAAVPAPAKAVRKDATPLPPVPKARTPRQMAEELIPILKNQKTPWQLYPSYVQIFTDFADKEKALAPANTPADAHAKRADQLRAMADQQWGVVKELQVKLRAVKA